jgi:hypothetical protein
MRVGGGWRVDTTLYPPKHPPVLDIYVRPGVQQGLYDTGVALAGCDVEGRAAWGEGGSVTGGAGMGG